MEAKLTAEYYNEACNENFTYNITKHTYISAPVTVISSLLSIFGSFLIIISYLIWRDVRRSTPRTILFFLAIADFAASIGYLFSAIVYLIIFEDVLGKEEDWSNIRLNISSTFIHYCQIESVWDTYFPVVSFFWTTNLAIYFMVTLVCHKGHLARKLLIPFHITAWGVPLIIVTVAAATGWLVPIPTVKSEYDSKQLDDTTAAAWCFVMNQITNLSKKNSSKIAVYYVFEALCGKGIELVSFAIVLVCYGLVIGYNRCKLCRSPCRRNTINDQAFVGSSLLSQDISLSYASALNQLDIKLFFVPILFIAFRIPGTLRYFLSFMHEGCVIPVYHAPDNSICINESCFNVLYNQELLDLQAFCDPLQGFVNAVLFIFLSKIISSRLLHSTGKLLKFLCCCVCLRKRRNYIKISSNMISDESVYSSTGPLSINNSSSDFMNYSGNNSLLYSDESPKFHQTL